MFRDCATLELASYIVDGGSIFSQGRNCYFGKLILQQFIMVSIDEHENVELGCDQQEGSPCYPEQQNQKVEIDNNSNNNNNNNNSNNDDDDDDDDDDDGNNKKNNKNKNKDKNKNKHQN